MAIAIELSANQALAASDATERLQVSEAELAAQPYRICWPSPAPTLIVPPNGSSTKTRSSIAAWSDALAPAGRSPGVTSSADGSH